MKSENLFMRLCRFCSQQIGSLEWFEQTRVANIFLPIIVGALFFIALYENYKFKGPMPMTNIVYGIVQLLVPLLVLVLCVSRPLMKDEKKHYLSIKLSVIVIQFLSGFSLFNLGHFGITVKSQLFMLLPINFYQDAMFMLTMMLICLVLMLIGLKYNVLLKVLSMLMNTRETKQYKGSAIIGLILITIITVNRLFLDNMLDNILFAIGGWIVILVGSYYMLSCILSFIYFIVQVKYPELRNDDIEK